MRRMLLTLIIVLVIMMTAVACGKEADADIKESVDFSRYSKSHRNSAMTEEGMFFFTDGLIHFISAETGEDNIFCFNLVCPHTPTSSDNRDPKCMAAGYYNGTYIVYHEKNIYFFVRETFEHRIYRMDVSSGMRELVAELPFSCQITDVVFNGDYAYYMAKMNDVADEEVGVVATVKGYEELVEVNLIDGSYRVLTKCGEETGGSFYDYDVCGRKLYYVLYTSEGRSVYSMNLDTLESELKVPSEEFLATKWYCGVYDEEHFFYHSESGDIGIYNINTDECKVIHKAELGDDRYFGDVMAGVGKIYYKVWVSSTEEYEYYLYDIAEDKLYDLTAKCRERELEIISYDPYNEMFEYIVYAEDGEEIKGFAPVSEATLRQNN